MDRSKDLSILTDKPSKSKPNSFFNDENIQALKKKVNGERQVKHYSRIISFPIDVRSVHQILHDFLKLNKISFC